jgi:hypothetical protein
MFESEDGQLAISLGASYPKDLSDRRENDKVHKYINISEVFTLEGESTGGGFYKIQLPDRSDLIESAERRRREIVNQLDWNMARAIFEDVYQLEPVKNQLTSLNQIVRWLYREGELPLERLDNVQRGNTREYIEVLESFDFVNVDDGIVRYGEKMEAVEIAGADDFEQVVVGQIISDAYNVLRDQLDLRMLNHYPKFANSYYYSAIQRREPNLHLKKRDLLENLRTEWGDDVDPWILEDKLDMLQEAEIINIEEDRLVSGKTEIYEAVISQSPTAAGV